MREVWGFGIACSLCHRLCCGAAYQSACESRTSCTRTRCCTTRGGRRLFFWDFNSESACIDGVVTLAYVIKVLSARGFGILDSCIRVCIPVCMRV